MEGIKDQIDKINAYICNLLHESFGKKPEYVPKEQMGEGEMEKVDWE